MKLESKVKAIKVEKNYGHLTLNSSNYPKIKELVIGEEKEIIVKVKVKGLRQPDNWEISENKMKPTDVIANVSITGIEHKSESKED